MSLFPWMGADGTGRASVPITMTMAAKTDRVAVLNVMSEGTMDRLIWTAWRAFWVGLGASAVILGHSLLAPAAPAVTAADLAAPAVQAQEPSFSAPSIHKTTQPVLSRVRTRGPHAS